MIVRLLRLVVATAVATTALVAVLPVAGRGRVPPTVFREVPVALEGLLERGARAVRTDDGLRPANTTWTRHASVCSPVTFTMAGVVWRQEGDEEVQAQVSWGTESATEGAARVDADPLHAPDPSSPEWTGLVGTDPVWTGGARCLRFRLRLPAGGDYSGLRVAYINTSGTADGGEPTADATWGLSPASARAPKPRIISRRGWGANERLRNCRPEYADQLRMAYVHHTVNGNTYSRAEADDIIRGIYAYHTNSLGYCDIAYNFLIDRYGRVYEGRFGGITRPVIGAHAMGFNTRSAGVAAVGDFGSHRPSRALVNAYRRLLAWRLDIAHIPPRGKTTMVSAGGSNQRFDKGQRVRLSVISGHRDTGYTACPGDRLYGLLAAIRRGVERRGLPKIYRPRKSRTAIRPGRSKARIQAGLSHRVAWEIVIKNKDGAVVRTFHGKAGDIERTWDGTRRSGAPVRRGPYRAVLSAKDGKREARRARLVFRVRPA
jgi:N-acetylmuramoyl-L-alanine amidase/FlgD Ig-like domain